MSNTLLSIGMITKEAMAILENTLSFTKFVNREYDDAFGNKSAQIGDTVSVRKPPLYTVGTTPTFSAQGTTETAVPITLNNQYNNGMSFTSKELTLDINTFSKQTFMDAAIAAIANKIDYDGMQQYLNVYQAVGTAGTTPSAISTFLSAGVKLDNAAAPNDNMRSVVVNPAAQAGVVGGAVTYFNPSQAISDQYLNGTMGRAAGFKWSMDQNVGVQTTGTFAALASGTGTAVTLSADFTGGTSIATTGWTSGDTLNVGDIIHIAGVYSVNPQNRQTTGQLQQFVIASTPTPAAGPGTITFTVSPSAVFTGATQNVTGTSNKGASGAVVTVEAASAVQTPQNLVFHRDAFTFATVPLELPMGPNTMAYRVKSKKLNMSIRALWFYDGFSDRQNLRFDILGGWATLRPELACRVFG